MHLLSLIFFYSFPHCYLDSGSPVILCESKSLVSLALGSVLWLLKTTGNQSDGLG